MTDCVTGLHHVTAIAGDPQRNVDFYTGVLGLRLVKQTVNFDVPETYHFYYGDETGRPGTLLTFFSWPEAPATISGRGQVVEISFSVPPGSLSFWREHLAEQASVTAALGERFGNRLLEFRDPDGLPLALLEERRGATEPGWTGGPVPGEHAVRALHGVTLSVPARQATEEILVEFFGFRREQKGPGRRRLVAPQGGPGSALDLLEGEPATAGRSGRGGVHHVAFRVAEPEHQLRLRERLLARGLHPTGVMDRCYFQSIYVREPGGVLFEVATDGPGFEVDEPLQALGQKLQLPSWLEPFRQQVEQTLPPIRVGG